MVSAFSATANGRVLNPPPTGGPVQSAVPCVDACARNFTVTHKRLTVDESRALQTDRGVGSKVGGWGEKNLKVVLLSIPPPPQSTHNTTPRFHDYSPISLFCLPGPGSCSFNGLILQLRLKALFLFIIVVIMESQSSSIWSPLSCVWRGVHYQLMRDVRPRVMKYT